MSRAVMQQALDALEKGETKLRWAAISALKQALAEPEQEPDGISWLKRDSGYFTAPTPRKPLTDEEIVQVLGSVRESITGSVFLAFARAVIAAYEAKNGIAGEGA